MQGRWMLTVWLAWVWFATLLYGEYIAFILPSFTCSWPPLKVNGTSDQGLDKPIRVALIADPQLTDRTTHGMAAGSLGLRFTQLYSDIYMRRAFRSAVMPLKPDQLIFLGDHFDGGPHLTDVEWETSLKRFEHVFDQSHAGSNLRHDSVPAHFLPGNHDLGYVETHWQLPQVLERYKSAFGSSNHTVIVGGVEFVFINAQVLDGPETDGQTMKSWTFIHQLSRDPSPHPRVLLTHIPLYRPDDTPCGSQRSSPVINQRIQRMPVDAMRIWYQNYLTEETSKKLLDLLKPVAVFSGHDHDQCVTTHVTSGSSIIEHTVGTFSWQNGNVYPSFMLISVSPVSVGNDQTLNPLLSSSLCFLPVQLFIYIWYAILAVVSVVAIFSWPAQGVHIRFSWEDFRSYVQGILNLQGPVKEKSDDVDTEWEMVWDAEGAMHLISKGHVKIVDNTQGLSSDIRGTAQARPAAAKRLATSEPDSTKPSTGEEQNAFGMKLTKNKGRSFTKRLLSGIGPLAALTAWSLALYVMLLMKDWSETENGPEFG